MKPSMQKNGGQDNTAVPTAKHQASSDETKIDVFVRCRGRSERELQENSTVVVRTNGIKSQTLELSMRPHALSNKVYSFDGVFSAAADQQLIFEEIASPVLDEVFKGFNCTIFAYGQTGTGKTHTMSGDISDHTLLSDDAGIAPRVLHSIFHRLNSLANSPSSGTTSDNSVKVSFIELYNEELRDLLSADETTNLKIFEGDGRRGAATIVQGMEEQFISSARKGLEILRTGSYKRQVAATKCNDLSSRSHTIFTVTVYTKQTLESGEETLSAGKLNLVDLAGSENIGRSGAEHKRAAEAGLINKSLLTLGRVINALVDRSAHIPYRESKLTRLLQNSLGGRTKTCIITTLSPAISNLNKTISSLDYAFRAKNIRNKPQVNQLIPKKTLLKELTVEIERLKSELTATRRRNGVYMTEEAHADMVGKSDSLTILVQDQREKIEAIECKLTRKGRDLLEVTASLDVLKRDNQITQAVLESTTSSLNEEKVAHADTKQSLANAETNLQQHEHNEKQLTNLNCELKSLLDQSNAAIMALHKKIQKQSEIQSQYQEQYRKTQLDAVDTAVLVDRQLAEFQTEHERLVKVLSACTQTYVQQELQQLHTIQSSLEEKNKAFKQSHQGLATQTIQGSHELSQLLDEVKPFSAELKTNFRTGLASLVTLVERTLAGITEQTDAFHAQLQASYSSLGASLRVMFDEASTEILDQQKEMQRLRVQMMDANKQLDQSQSHTESVLSEFVAKERTLRDQENDELMRHIQHLLETKAQQQQQRLAVVEKSSAQLMASRQCHSTAGDLFARDSENLLEQSRHLGGRLTGHHDSVKMYLTKVGPTAVARHAKSLKAATTTAHDEIAQLAEQQTHHFDTKSHSLEHAIQRMQQHNNTQLDLQQRSLSNLGRIAHESHTSLADALAAPSNRLQCLDHDVAQHADNLHESLSHLNQAAPLRQHLTDLRQRVEKAELANPDCMGETPSPPKKHISYPAAAAAAAPALQHPTSPEPTSNPPPPPPPPPPPRETTSSPCKIPVFTSSPSQQQQQQEQSQPEKPRAPDPTARVLAEKSQNLPSISTPTAVSPRSLKRPCDEWHELRGRRRRWG